jgi:hypothetical protein
MERVLSYRKALGELKPKRNHLAHDDQADDTVWENPTTNGR